MNVFPKLMMMVMMIIHDRMCSLDSMWYHILRTTFYLVRHPAGAVQQVCRPCVRETLSVFDASASSDNVIFFVFQHFITLYMFYIHTSSIDIYFTYTHIIHWYVCIICTHIIKQRFIDCAYDTHSHALQVRAPRARATCANLPADFLIFLILFQGRASIPRAKCQPAKSKVPTCQEQSANLPANF